MAVLAVFGDVAAAMTVAGFMASLLLPAHYRTRWTSASEAA